jgi:hypothetical protein
MQPLIEDTIKKFQCGKIDKPTFIELMYQYHHHSLFDYAKYLQKTNIKSIEILDDDVIMTSRDRGIRISCQPKDFRIAPIEILNFNDYEKSESRILAGTLLIWQLPNAMPKYMHLNRFQKLMSN